MSPDGESDGKDTETPAPLSPEKFLAFAETVRSIGLRIYAGFVGVPTDDPAALAIFDMGKGERETLELWAPEAADYFGKYIGVDGPIGAWTFAGIYIAGLWGATGRLKQLAPKPVEKDFSQVPIGVVPMQPRRNFGGIPNEIPERQLQ